MQFHLRTHNHRTHGVDAFQRAVDIHAVKNLKAGFPHRRAQTRGAALHLLVENAAFDFAQEHNITDRRNIHAGGQQIDGDHDIRQPLFVEADDHALHFLRVFIGVTSDLDDRVVFQLRVLFLKRGAQLVHHHIGMGVGDAEHQRFLLPGGIQVFGELAAYRAVKRRDHQATVKISDLKILIVSQCVVDQLALRVQAFHLFAFGKVDPILRVAGDDLNRRILVDQEAVDHRRTVGVAVNRLAENIDRVQGWCGGQGNFYRIEVIENATVGGNVIQLTAELQLAFGLLFIENVAAVRFIDDDTVVAADRHRFIRLQRALDQ